MRGQSQSFAAPLRPVCAALTADGRLLLGGWEAALLLSLAGAKVLQSFPFPGDWALKLAQAQRTEQFFVGLGSGQLLRLCRSGAAVELWPGTGAPLTALGALYGCGVAVAGWGDATLRAFSDASLSSSLTAEREMSAAVMQLAMPGEGDRFYVGCADGSVLGLCARDLSLTCVLSREGPPALLWLSADLQRLYHLQRGKLRALDPLGGEPETVAELQHGSAATVFILDRFERTVAIATGSGDLGFWSLERSTKAGGFELHDAAVIFAEATEAERLVSVDAAGVVCLSLFPAFRGRAPDFKSCRLSALRNSVEGDLRRSVRLARERSTHEEQLRAEIAAVEAKIVAAQQLKESLDARLTRAKQTSLPLCGECGEEADGLLPCGQLRWCFSCARELGSCPDCGAALGEVVRLGG